MLCSVRFINGYLLDYYSGFTAEREQDGSIRRYWNPLKLSIARSNR